ncbi:diacylglycerol kinase family protein [Paenibacillus sp. sgz302251]|uniref:diacylglycerol kinase family protein n=1 Tax=Paenibacillus sp. sgz302251 TaxID=3414493 RepID=UPI003C7B4CE9
MRKFMRSFLAAGAGVGFAIRTQSHMRFHIAAAIMVCGLGWLVSLKPLEWAIIIVTIAMVMTAEMMNTAIEQAVDLASPNIHPIAKIAKDAAAGAVLISAALSLVVGLLIMGPPLWHLLVK